MKLSQQQQKKSNLKNFEYIFYSIWLRQSNSILEDQVPTML